MVEQIFKPNLKPVSELFELGKPITGDTRQILLAWLEVPEAERSRCINLVKKKSMENKAFYSMLRGL